MLKQTDIYFSIPRLVKVGFLEEKKTDKIGILQR